MWEVMDVLNNYDGNFLNDVQVYQATLTYTLNILKFYLLIILQ